jgi:hypothetical protein
VIGRAAIHRDVVIVACAISAGIHAALAPGHLAEGAAPGASFVAAAALLAGLVLALTRAVSAAALAGAAALLGGLIASYGLAVTTGLPLLHPHPEPVGGLALFTNAVELAGLLASVRLLRRRQADMALSFPRPKGTLA